MRKTFYFHTLLSAIVLMCCVTTQTFAQKTFGNLSPLRIDGKHIKDPHGNIVRLHGVMDTPSPYFNSGRWGWYDLQTQASTQSVRTACITYFDRLFTAITDTTQGAYCNVFRLHLDPCWTNDNNVTYSYTNDEGKTVTVGQTGDGEANIQHFSKNRLTTYMKSLYFLIAQKAMNHGMYVIMRPPGVCPRDIYVGGDYQHYLLDVWDIVSKNDSVRKHSGQLIIELANEPVNVYNADGSFSPNTLHDFFQPIVDKIRANGFTGIILAPGTGYQSNYTGYENYPVTGYNIGYAVHVYPGWYDQNDSNADGEKFIANFARQVPVVKNSPVVVTEIDWSPENSSGEIDHYNEFGDPVYKNFGTWATASTSKWGKAWREVHDYYGNIGMTLTSSDDYLDWNAYSNSNYNTVKAAFSENEECCAKACFDWYKVWNMDTRAYMDFTRQWTPDQGNGKYKNPILNADFPDPDVIRVGDTFYMVATTMFHFPGATILKSKDLVNWEYCCNPLKQIANSDNYNLLNNLNHYAQGQWASSLSYSNGKYYLYFISYGKEDAGKNVMLTATDPQGEWTMEYWPEHYYDSGWLFDDGENGDGNVYVACGIGTIYVNKLDGKTLKKLSSKAVIENYTIKGQKCDGIEGSHMYHIGDYYYIYATTGGYFRGQQIFRSTDPMGPYEECPYMVFENQGIHQGGLVDTQTGEWWTILFKDAGAIGRVLYLEPVKWVDGWPVVGNNGVDVSKNNDAYKKPDVGQGYPITYLPTNDTFTDPQLGMQWGWNHNPDDAAWSLMDNPGSLRLYTSGITEKGLLQARNSLTQRIWSYVPEGTSTANTLDSYGTVKMNIANMKDGDVAGIAVFQDPFSLIGIKQKDGKRYLYSEKTYVTATDGTNKSQTGVEITDDVVYLRAVANFGTNKAKFYYSLDNKTYTRFGVEMDMRFVLSVFVGQRFYIFNYATQENGGYVDVDWFSTEPSYEEEMFYAPGTLHAYSAEDLTMEKLTVNKKRFEIFPDSSCPVEIICTAQSGNVSNVTGRCSYTVSNGGVISIENGSFKTLGPGITDVTATYSDMFGNTQEVTFTVNVTFFPFSEEGFNPTIWDSNSFTYNSTDNYATIKMAAYGFAGWKYGKPMDLSGYNYIVVKLRSAATCSPSFRIFDQDNYWSDPFAANFGSAKSIKIDLHNMKNSKGMVVDPSHIYIAGFWSFAGTIYVSDIFVSQDGINPATDIDDVFISRSNPNNTIYNLSGQRLSKPGKGINIVNGKKYIY